MVVMVMASGWAEERDGSVKRVPMNLFCDAYSVMGKQYCFLLMASRKENTNKLEENCTYLLF